MSPPAFYGFLFWPLSTFHLHCAHIFFEILILLPLFFMPPWKCFSHLIHEILVNHFIYYLGNSASSSTLNWCKKGTWSKAAQAEFFPWLFQTELLVPPWIEAWGVSRTLRTEHSLKTFTWVLKKQDLIFPPAPSHPPLEGGDSWGTFNQ